MMYGPLIVTPSPLVSGEVGLAYNVSLSASGGTAPYTWAVNSGVLPAGLSLSPGGVISGIPTSISSSVFTIGLVDSNGVPTSKPFGLTVVSQLQITTASPLPSANQGAPYSAPVTASGGAGGDEWFITSQSATFNTYAINPTTGVVTSLAANAGSDTIAIKVVDALGAVAQSSFTVTINAVAGLKYVGVNSSTLSYADPAQPFLNLFNGCGTNVLFSAFNTTVGTSAVSTNEEQFLAFDANGYVTSLIAVGESSQSFTAVGTGMNISLGTAPGATGPYPPGPYTFQCKGAGVMVFGGDVSSLSSPSTGLSISGNQITSTLSAGQIGTCTVNIPSPSGGIRFWVTSITTPGTNYPQDFALYLSSRASNFAAGQIAHPLWLAAYANYGFVRGMDQFNTLNQEICLNFTSNLTTGQSGTFSGTAIIQTTNYTTWPLLSGTYNFLFTTGQTIAVSCTFGSGSYAFTTALTGNLPAPSGTVVHCATPVQASWAQRAIATQCSYIGIKGIPYEIFMQMCNELNGSAGADSWLCIPGASNYFDSSYATNLAKLAFNGAGTTLAGFTGLNVNKKTIAELANEIWNFPNTNSKWFYLLMTATQPSWGSSAEVYATQVANVGDAFFGVYGSSLQYGGATTGRAVVSMGGQFTTALGGNGNSIYYMRQQMLTPNWTSAAYTHHIGSFHYAHYFNGNPNSTDAANILASTNPTLTWAGLMYSQTSQGLTCPSVPSGGFLGSLISAAQGIFAYWAANPQTGGWQSWPCYAYEGGSQWLEGSLGSSWSTFLNQFSRTIYRGYCNYDPTNQLSSGPGLFAAMEAAGFSASCQFQGTGSYTVFGNYGALENVMQPTSGPIGGPTGVPYNYASIMAHIGVAV